MNDHAWLDDLLADPSAWVEPAPGLEDTVVSAVADAEPEPGSRSTVRTVHRRRRTASLLAVAAAVAVAVVVGAVALTGNAANPDYTGTLSATGLSPGARADVTIRRTDAGFRVSLDARGLPPLSQDEFYQAWMKDAAGTLVPIGTFSSSDDRVTLWSGVSPRDFPTITVTIEPRDNNQASSGQRVLVGDVHARA
jgi:Anti-sigma-K factor rskA